MTEQSPLPTEIAFDGQTLRYSQLHLMFGSTEPGQILASRTRWDRYKPDFVTNNEWIKMFGSDVNNFEHMRLTYGQTRWFLRECQSPSGQWNGPISEEATFDQHEQEDLMLMAIVHDWGEAITGDKMHDLKTDDERSEEARQFNALVLNTFGNNTYKALAERIVDVAEEAESKTATKLGRAFNAIERIGFSSTGLRAWRINNAQENEAMQEACLWMASNATGNQLVRLVDFSRTYPPVKRFLEIHSHTISDLLTNMHEDIFEKYTDGTERAAQKQKFIKAQEVWSQYA